MYYFIVNYISHKISCLFRIYKTRTVISTPLIYRKQVNVKAMLVITVIILKFKTIEIYSCWPFQNLPAKLQIVQTQIRQHFRSSLMRIYTVCLGIFVRLFWVRRVSNWHLKTKFGWIRPLKGEGNNTLAAGITTSRYDGLTLRIKACNL